MAESAGLEAAVTAAVQAALAPAITAAVQAGAAAGAAASAAAPGSGSGGPGEGLDAEALAAALGAQLESALQPVVAELKVSGAGNCASGPVLGWSPGDGRHGLTLFPSHTLQSHPSPSQSPLPKQEVVQAVRSTEGQLVRAVQDSAASARAAAKEDARLLFNSVRAAHNQAQLARPAQSSSAKLMPLKNVDSELPPPGGGLHMQLSCCMPPSLGGAHPLHPPALPPAGLFPETAADAHNLLEYRYRDSRQDARVYKLLRFYKMQSGGSPYPATEALPSGYGQAEQERQERVVALRSALQL